MRVRVRREPHEWWIGDRCRLCGTRRAMFAGRMHYKLPGSSHWTPSRIEPGCTTVASSALTRNDS